MLMMADFMAAAVGSRSFVTACRTLRRPIDLHWPRRIQIIGACYFLYVVCVNVEVLASRIGCLTRGYMRTIGD